MLAFSRRAFVALALGTCAPAHAQDQSEALRSTIPAIPAADRELSGADLRTLLDYSDFLINSNNDAAARDLRAMALGERFRHRYCLPSLVAVVRNRSEPQALRHRCLQSISAIDDARVVDYLVELIPEENLGRRANDNLMMITGVSVGIINPMLPDLDGAFRRALQDRWRRWWKHNRGKTVLKSNSLASEALFYKELKDEDLDK